MHQLCQFKRKYKSCSKTHVVNSWKGKTWVRPVFLKPGVATHLCVAEILQCVAKLLYNILFE